MTEKDIQVELGQTGEIELPTLDISQYVGRDVKISEVTEHEGQFGYYIRIVTDSVDTIKNAKNEDIALRASKVFGLQEDANGKIGWGKDTKLGKYLAKKGVSHYKDLVGVSVKCQAEPSRKDEKDYLGFN